MTDTAPKKLKLWSWVVALGILAALPAEAANLTEIVQRKDRKAAVADKRTAAPAAPSEGAAPSQSAGTPSNVKPERPGLQRVDPSAKRRVEGYSYDGVGDDGFIDDPRETGDKSGYVFRHGTQGGNSTAPSRFQGEAKPITDSDRQVQDDLITDTDAPDR